MAPQGVPAGPVGAPAAPAKAPSEPSYGPIVLGAVGGLVVLVGALLGWALIQTCASAAGFFSMCVTAPMPASVSLDPMLGMAPTIAMLCALLGIVMLVLQKPVTGIAAGLMGVAALLFAVVYLTSFSGVETAITTGFGVGASVNVSVGIGVYITMVGGLLMALGGFLQFSKLKAPAASAATPVTA